MVVACAVIVRYVTEEVFETISHSTRIAFDVEKHIPFVRFWQSQEPSLLLHLIELVLRQTLVFVLRVEFGLGVCNFSKVSSEPRFGGSGSGVLRSRECF